jgi:tellurite resistance-related uncharacterized protein
MKRIITGFHQDTEQDWLAELDCHHQQHVRHTPPFINRPWVRTQSQREERIGTCVDCVLCDRLDMPTGLAAYKRTPEFSEQTTPKNLLKNHSTKRGVWGKIHILAGELEYTVEDPQQRSFILGAGDTANIAPQALHRVTPRGPVRFFVEFYQPAAEIQDPREGETT